MKSTRLNPFQVLRDQLAIMSFYERFEQVVALVLSAVIAVIIVVSLFQLISIVFTLLVLDAFNPLDHKVFQSVFGMIMTLLIAMEFKHSIVRVALRRDSIIQVKTVILIGLIALARKFVILEPEASPAKIAALAGATLAGSTPKSRTVVEGLRTSGLALRPFAASSGCGTARCIRTHRPLPHRVSGKPCGRPARA